MVDKMDNLDNLDQIVSSYTEYTNFECLIGFLKMLFPLVLFAVVVTLSVAYYKAWERRRLQDPTKDLIHKKHGNR